MHTKIYIVPNLSPKIRYCYRSIIDNLKQRKDRQLKYALYNPILLISYSCSQILTISIYIATNQKTLAYFFTQFFQLL